MEIRLSIQNIFIILAIGIPIILTVINVMRRKEFDEAIEPIISGCSTIITFLLMVSFYEQFDLLAKEVLSFINREALMQSGIIHIAIIAIMFCVFKLILQNILRVLNKISVNSLLDKIKKKKLFLFLTSVMLGFVRGLILIILISIPIVLYNNITESSKEIKILEGIKPYDNIAAVIDNKKLFSISSGLTQDVKNTNINKIVYYNGVTIDQGVESNTEIQEKAIEITKNRNSDRDKAKAIYKWVGANIKYDDDKARQVISNEKNIKSGAIEAFQSRKGICFDYACLFTAMAKSVGLKSRVIVGEAYNGEEFISHAWNQVYLADEGKWVKLDPTFYQAGNYFDNQNFDEEHAENGIAGEF